MEILFFIINIILGSLALITLINVLTAPMLKNPPVSIDEPSVSVLVPARNEAHNISACLSGLIRQDYPQLEILVLDDYSTDGTADIVTNIIKENPDKNIRLLNGEKLPADWTGKNWACHQLGRQATGDIIIFTDADNQHAPNAVCATVAWMHKYKLGLLSAFPQQITKGLAEKLVVPVMDLFVYSLLPLWLTRKCKRPSLAAANGQWLAFTRSAYENIGGHKAVKSEIVEDTTMARHAKQHGLNILTTSGKLLVFGRMYSNWPQVFKGFSKNAFGLWGYNLPGFMVFLGLLFLVFIFPYLVLPFYHTLPVFLAIGLNMFIRIMLVIKYSQPAIESILLHPVAIMLVLIIAVNSIYRYYSGSIFWKSREVFFDKG